LSVGPCTTRAGTGPPWDRADGHLSCDRFARPTHNRCMLSAAHNYTTCALWLLVGLACAAVFRLLLGAGWRRPSPPALSLKWWASLAHLA
jgi:hypothetical protein